MQRFEARRDARERVPSLELAMIIEKHRGRALPAAFSDYLTQHFRGEIKGAKGPKLQSDAEKDFRFGPADNLYRRILPIFEYLAKRRKKLVLKRRITKSASSPQNEPRTPSDRALDYVLKSLKDECDLRTVSADRLQMRSANDRARSKSGSFRMTSQMRIPPTNRFLLRHGDCHLGHKLTSTSS